MYDEDDVAMSPNITEEDRILERQNRTVDNYSTVEIVAVPPDFDIMQYLTMRESAGIFNQKGIQLKTLTALADGVKYSPVFCIQNNIRLKPITCMFFIKVLNELGLVLKSIRNPLREDLERYMEQLDECGNDTYLYVRGQEVKRVNFTIINIFPLMNDDVIHEAMEIAQRLQEQQQQFEGKLATIKTNLEAS